jgi:hypothetical protein
MTSVAWQWANSAQPRNRRWLAFAPGKLACTIPRVDEVTALPTGRQWGGDKRRKRFHNVCSASWSAATCDAR